MKPDHGAQKEHVHFIGIGGSGLSAIARMLKESGYTVTGSDMTLSPFAADLQIGEDSSGTGETQGAHWVARSTDDAPMSGVGRHAGFPFNRGRLPGQVHGTRTHRGGRHAWHHDDGVIAPLRTGQSEFHIGGVPAWRQCGPDVERFVGRQTSTTACLGLEVASWVTSLEHDHPDCFPTFEDMVSAFESFVALLPHDGTLIGCLDDGGSASLMVRARRLGHRVMAYSLQHEVTITARHWMQGRNVQPNRLGGFDFEAATNVGGTKLVSLGLKVPGEHNVSNALAALSVCATLGMSIMDAAEALGRFTGTGRRFEVKGESRDIVVIDDYAHHPTEIRATLAAARARYAGRRIWAVWQPHTYSRTQALFEQFVQAFGDADETIVTEIYRSREAAQAYSAEQVVRAMNSESVRFIPTLEAATGYLLQHLQKNDVVLVLSAGDADQISANVLAGLGNEVKHG
jgi:UDP-N-acetylmuramate--alanine ligase